MKITRSRFYEEVTGRATGNLGTTMGALRRWQVPFDDNATPRAKIIDIAHLPAARAAWMREQAELAERIAHRANAPKHNGADATAPAPPGSVIARLDAIEQKLDKLLAAWRIE